jgi:hypothetical protein
LTLVVWIAHDIHRNIHDNLDEADFRHDLRHVIEDGKGVVTEKS